MICVYALILITLLLNIAMSEKVLVINFSKADLETRRIKVDPIEESITTYEDIKTFLALKLFLKVNEFDIEKLDTSLGLYVPVIYKSVVPWKNNFLALLLVFDNNNCNQQLRIEGRAFNLSVGLPIGSFYILRISELEEASLGTGLNVWDGSVVLAKYLEIHTEIVSHKHVLELGAGTGVAGMAAGLLGARYVLLTDLEYAVSNLRRNADNNFAQLQQQVDSNVMSHEFSYDVKMLDWNDKLTYPTVNSSVTDVDIAQRSPADTLQQTFDLIIGADIVWLEHLIPMLIDTLVACMSQNTLLLLSHQTRSERTDKLLFDSLDAYFVIEEVSKSEYHKDFRSNKIRIFTGRIKSNSM